MTSKLKEDIIFQFWHNSIKDDDLKKWENRRPSNLESFVWKESLSIYVVYLQGVPKVFILKAKVSTLQPIHFVCLENYLLWTEKKNRNQTSQ